MHFAAVGAFVQDQIASVVVAVVFLGGIRMDMDDQALVGVVIQPFLAFIREDCAVVVAFFIEVIFGGAAISIGDVGEVYACVPRQANVQAAVVGVFAYRARLGMAASHSSVVPRPVRSV